MSPDRTRLPDLCLCGLLALSLPLVAQDKTAPPSPPASAATPVPAPALAPAPAPGAPSSAAQEPGKGAAEKPLTLQSPDGQDHEPLSAGKKQGVVLFFVSAYCPTSNNFVPEMNAIAADHAASFQFYFVHADKDQKTADIVQHTELNEIKATVLMDKEQKLARLEHARTTPEAVVLTPDGKTAYQGRVNDLYLSPTKRQRKATTTDLRDALEAIKSGKPAPAPAPPAVGCRISGVE